MSTPQKPKKLMDVSTFIFFGVILAIIAFMMFNPNSDETFRAKHLAYNEFVQEVVYKNVDVVVMNDDKISGRLNDGTTFTTIKADDVGLMDDLLNNGVKIQVVEKPTPSFFNLNTILMIIFIGVIIYFFRKQSKMMPGGQQKGKSKFEAIPAGGVLTRFTDVAGVPESKAELEDMIAFLRNPERFTKLGGKMNRGVLMTGSPGCGKTLLAKAVAGEAGCAFIATDGAQFVEKFVGVGAGRVRELLEEANKHERCIVFIDEIDGIGKSRSSGMGSNDEREQTLNQLLTSMDGFDPNSGVIFIAATNRPEILDAALTRPGRFDVEVNVPLPDINGRVEILNVHAVGKPMAEDVDFMTVAKGCVGMSGADLANLLNQAAVLAAKLDDDYVSMTHIEKSKDKIMMGSERKGMVMDEKEKECTAYHEAGHAIIGMTVPEHDPVHKVSILPRGKALGVTMYLPEKDRLSYSKARLKSQLCSLYGGRVAEELIYGKENITTGASNDLERVSDLAYRMVTEWGFGSSDLGVVNVSKDPNSYSDNRSEALKSLIERDRKQLLDDTYAEVKTILKDKIDILHAMTGALMEFETIDRKQVEALMEEDSK